MNERVILIKSQKQKAICYIIHLYKLSRVGKSIEIESRLAVARSWIGGGGSNCTGFSFGVMNIFWN